MRRPLLLADRGCPFAHRVRALLAHLEIAYELREAPVGTKPEGITQWSSSGRIPLLVHGDLVIGESRVMLEYIAEAHGFAAAYPAGLVERTRMKHAMALVDSVLAPRLTGPAPLAQARLEECLDVLAGVTQTPPEPSLLAFHLAPIAQRFRWWWPDAPITRAIAARPQLSAWLENASALAALTDTAPPRAENEADFAAACALMRPAV